jgi:hypothetical protein
MLENENVDTFRKSLGSTKEAMILECHRSVGEFDAGQNGAYLL